MKPGTGRPSGGNFTHQNELADHKLWSSKANEFNDAAKLMYELRGGPSGFSVVGAFLAAVSIELILKAHLTKRAAVSRKGHDLRTLLDQAGLSLSEDKCHTLDLLSEIHIWRGRYPTPNKDHQFARFYEEILEQHIVRTRSGSVSSVLADQSRFPTLKNYNALWEILLNAYES
jgi:HEPN domain-containing protein